MVVLDSTLLAALGTTLGAGLGWAENAILYRYPIDLSSSVPEASVGGFFFDMSLQMNLSAFHFAFTIVVVFLLVLIAGLYPAWKAGSVEPLEALHTI